MITATATGANGQRIIVLGLTRGNVTRLMAGDPMRVDAEHHPGFPPDLKILIYFGETERSITEPLKPLIGADTKVVAVPKDDHTPRVSRMARPLLVLDEVLAMLDVVGAPASLREKFKAQAEKVLAHKVRRTTRDDSADTITVGSGYGTVSKRGHVELLVNDEVIQMDTAKAREVGLMLIEAAEAGTSDEIVMTLLRDRVGITDLQRLGQILMDLREIRQGTRAVAWPS